MAQTIALVPARGGSKGVPGKNIKLLGGFPMLAYAIEAGLTAERIDRVVVTTDSPEIAELARQYGAETPFLRPAAISGDRATDLEFVMHALDWLRDNEGEEPDLLVQLRPTTPLRDPALLDGAVAAFRARPEATALRSAHPLAEPPQKMMGIADGWFTGLFPHDPRPEYYNLPRQAFPTAYLPNGYVDLLRTAHLRSQGTLHGPRVMPFETPFAPEVDTVDDFELLEFRLDRNGHKLHDRLVSRYGIQA